MAILYNLYHTVDDDMGISTGFRDGRHSQITVHLLNS